MHNPYLKRSQPGVYNLYSGGVGIREQRKIKRTLQAFDGKPGHHMYDLVPTSSLWRVLNMLVWYDNTLPDRKGFVLTEGCSFSCRQCLRLFTSCKIGKWFVLEAGC